MKEALRTFAMEVVSGEQKNWRIWNKPGITTPEDQQSAFNDLRTNKLVPKELTLKQYLTWQEPTTLDLEEILDYEISDVQHGMKEIFSQAIADHHLEEKDLRINVEAATMTLTEITSPLALMNERLRILRAKADEVKKAKRKKDVEAIPLTADEEAELATLREEVTLYRSEHGERIDQLKALLYLDRLKHIGKKDLETKSITVNNARVPFEQVFKIIEQAFVSQHPDFATDVQRLKTTLLEGHENIYGNSRIAKTTLHVTDDIDLETALKIGEIPVPSCQSYLSMMSYNVGLLSYASDPNVKIIMLYDNAKKPIARSIVRLLEDEFGKPQLFIERLYSTNSHSKIGQAIQKVVIDKAKQMGVGVYTHSKESVEDIESITTADLTNHRSRTPWVYTDAGGGKCKDGTFTVHRAIQVA